MTKLQDLEKRADKLEPEATDEVEGKALQAWIWVHLTEKEAHDAVTLLKRFKDNEPGRPTEAELESYKALIAVGIERAKKETEADWLEWKDKRIRAETIRHVQRLMTEPEHDELNILNGWLWDHACFHPETEKLGPL